MICEINRGVLFLLRQLVVFGIESSVSIRDGSSFKLSRYIDTDATQNGVNDVLPGCPVAARDDLLDQNFAATECGYRPVILSIVQSQAKGSGKLVAEPEICDAPVVRDIRQQIVRNLQDYVQSQQRQIRLETANKHRQTVISILDPMSERVVREIPSRDFLAASCGLARSRIKSS